MKILIATFTALMISVKADRVLDSSIYKPESLLYKANNNIVDIHSSTVNTDLVFFVEREDNGSFKGIFTLEDAANDRSAKFFATSILNNGRCTASDDKTVFIGAADGIYTYNFAAKIAEKYGNITADIKAIQKDSKQDIIYVVADNQLSKVTEMGTKMSKISNDVQQVVLDKDDNVYFYGSALKKPKVIVRDEINEINGLPEKHNQIKLIRSFAFTDGVFLLLNKKLYRVFANGTSVETEYVFNKVPTAFYLDLGIIQLFGYNKEIYSLNLIEPILRGLSSTITDFYSTIFINRIPSKQEG